MVFQSPVHYNHKPPAKPRDPLFLSRLGLMLSLHLVEPRHVLQAAGLQLDEDVPLAMDVAVLVLLEDLARFVAMFLLELLLVM